MNVYVLFHETNTGRTEVSDGCVEAVYATAEIAEAARLAAIRKARDEGKEIWIDPDNPDDEGNEDWSDDWTVEAHNVEGAASPVVFVEIRNGVPNEIAASVEGIDVRIVQSDDEDDQKEAEIARDYLDECRRNCPIQVEW